MSPEVLRSDGACRPGYECLEAGAVCALVCDTPGAPCRYPGDGDDKPAGVCRTVCPESRKECPAGEPGCAESDKVCPPGAAQGYCHYPLSTTRTYIDGSAVDGYSMPFAIHKPSIASACSRNSRRVR